MGTPERKTIKKNTLPRKKNVQLIILVKSYTARDWLPTSRKENNEQKEKRIYTRVGQKVGADTSIDTKFLMFRSYLENSVSTKSNPLILDTISCP